MSITVALAGDTMLGRGVAEALTSAGPESLFAPELTELCRSADLFVLNLECCISSRGTPWPAPGKPFFFRSPPMATDALNLIGVHCVTLANNHVLDFGEQALSDTLDHLSDAGIVAVGAGPDSVRARAPAILEAKGVRLAVFGFTDHPSDFAAGVERSGVAFADLRAGVPGWLEEAIRAAKSTADLVLLTPHWGPNMTSEQVFHVREAATKLVQAGASLVAGHSAHVVHGVGGKVLYDLGDFIDDYRVDPIMRNDLGLLFLVELDTSGPIRAEAVPLRLEYCRTGLAVGEDAAWIRRRFHDASAALGTEVVDQGARLLVRWR
jgi:poly-gamma-glutamate capsule biosynthesis protein CapA/YwtB (metallophosphatase superfamily)